MTASWGSVSAESHDALEVVRHGERMSLAERLLTPGDLARLADESAVGRERLLSGRSALVLAASRLLHVDPATLTVEARCPDCGRSHGRPSVTGAPRPVQVSLTHAGGHAFAVASARPVGIDAEPADMPEARRAAVLDIAPPPAGVDPIVHWTRIEAVLKADGRGLRVDPCEVRFDGDRAQVADGVGEYRVRTHDHGGFVVSIATLSERAD